MSCRPIPDGTRSLSAGSLRDPNPGASRRDFLGRPFRDRCRDRHPFGLRLGHRNVEGLRLDLDHPLWLADLHVCSCLIRAAVR